MEYYTVAHTLKKAKGRQCPDGMAQAREWLSLDGENANPLYVATVALPYLALKQIGLVKE